MKRTVIILTLAMLICTSAFAFDMPDVGSWIKSISMTAIAMALTVIIGIAGLATRAKWLSAICLTIAALINTIAAPFKAFGLALQDGKIDADELRDIAGSFTPIGTQFKSVITVFRAKV